MNLVSIPNEFLHAKIIIERLKMNGFEAYFVGGSVRDALLGKKIHDVDIATSAYPEEIKQVFPRTIDVGIEHGTVLVLEENEQYEITTFRTESTYQDFRRPDKVTFVRSLKEDLKRRDFTINALAMTVDGEIIDLFDGIDDLNSKIIQAVGNPKERFHEDALRMMRGMRFASQLNFSIEENTLTAIETFHPLLDKISIERISVEFEKLLLGQNRRAGLIPFIETECYQYCPGLRNFGEQLFQFSELPELQIQENSQAWTLLIKILGLSQKDTYLFLKEWKLSNRLIATIQQLLKGLDIRLEGEWQLTDLYHLGFDNIISVENMMSYFGKESKIEEVRKLYERMPIHERSELMISGNDLLKAIDLKPGKWIGEMIEEIEIDVIVGQVPNEKEALILYALNRMSQR